MFVFESEREREAKNERREKQLLVCYTACVTEQRFAPLFQNRLFDLKTIAMKLCFFSLDKTSAIYIANLSLCLKRT